MSAEYACVERVEDLRLLKGSKYIPTHKRVLVDGKYVPLLPLVAEKLSTGREVLFTGLGCDAAALLSYLKANHVDTTKLFTADLICYGPALPEVHRQYVVNLEAKYHSRITSFTVRHKAKGWTPPYVRAVFEDGREFLTEFYESDYGKAFGKFTRAGCYKCPFKGEGHKADLTLGDYWGLTPAMPGWNNDGVSVFIVRTEKGEELISRISGGGEFELREEDVNFVLEHNRMYSEARKKPVNWEEFCGELESVGLHKALVRSTGFFRWYGGLVKRAVKMLLPMPVKRVLKRILRRG